MVINFCWLKPKKTDYQLKYEKAIKVITYLSNSAPCVIHPETAAALKEFIAIVDGK